MKFLIILQSLFAFCFTSEIVHLEHGLISGTTYQLPNGRSVYAFYGVPYAAPPIQKNRFKEPQNVQPWAGIWNASTISSPCLQNDLVTHTILGDEDCLYVNVFTPKLPKDGVSPQLDVLVYIHGGGFNFGTGNAFFPDYIMMNNDIVSVMVNYRLGSLGFLSTGDNVVPGNNGLKDQSAALKWVHHNIAKFGGHPASVTIAGCSAGGASVQYHFLSPLSDGYFQKGISFSGSVLLPWTLSQHNTEKSIHLAALLGCPTHSTQDAVACLTERPAKQILNAALSFQPWRYSPFTPFGPVVEPPSPNAFISEKPNHLLSKGLVKDLPWLVTFNTDEGLFPSADFIDRDEYLQELESGWQTIAPHLFFFNYSLSTDAEKNEVSQAIKKFYFNNKPLSRKTVSKLVEALGDRIFFKDIIRAAKLQSSVNKENVYCFMFNYRGKYSATNAYANDLKDYGRLGKLHTAKFHFFIDVSGFCAGSLDSLRYRTTQNRQPQMRILGIPTILLLRISHADDIMYIFKNVPTSSLETKSDEAMVQYLTSVIARFIKTGNPNFGKTKWQPLSKNINDKFECLYINSPNDQNMGELSKAKASEFWKNILPSEYETDFISREEL
ncbi:hypothetical protein V9T40_012704 [Parthenolecanium corni]|uniref:Carboxylic ester hydrolase n=1 Tax=Parthenolecanium corni TaxID=536013 RepID=A0AAN9T7Q5_9HEMI